MGNTAKLVSANVVAQAIALLIYPVLTRIYSPDDFGLFNLFLSIGGVIVIAANAEIQYSIVLPKSERTAVACFHNGLSVVIGVTAVCMILLPLSDAIAGIFDVPQLARWLPLMPLFVFVSSFWILTNYWLTRNKQFGQIATYQLSQSILGAGSKTGLGAAGLTGGGMIVGTIVAQAVALAVTIKTSFKRCLKPLLHIDREECRAAARQNVNFPKYDLPRAVIDNFSNNLPFFMLTPFFGLAEVGFLGMAFTLAMRPVTLVCNSLNQILYQKTAEQVQNRLPISEVFSRFTRGSLLCLVPAFAALFLILPWLTECLLGSGWHVVGEYIRLMLPWVLMVWLTASVNYLPDVFQRQRGLLVFEVVHVLLRAVALSAGIVSGNFRLALTLYSAVGFVTLTVEYLWFRQIIVRYESQIVSS